MNKLRVRIGEQVVLAKEGWHQTLCAVLLDSLMTLAQQESTIHVLRNQVHTLSTSLHGAELELKYADRRIKDMQRERFKGVDSK